VQVALEESMDLDLLVLQVNVDYWGSAFFQTKMVYEGLLLAEVKVVQLKLLAYQELAHQRVVMVVLAVEQMLLLVAMMTVDMPEH
jgi:hypothetical protein